MTDADDLPRLRTAARDLAELLEPGPRAALEPALRELNADAPDRARVGASLEQALDLAKESEAFAQRIDAAEPCVQRLVDWLGRDWSHVAGLLRHKEFGQRYPIRVVPYDPTWADAYAAEAAFLRERFPGVVLRTEHFGSTAVPGLAAKPVVDVLVELSSFEAADETLRPVLEAEGYACFWRSDSPPGHLMACKGYGPDGYLPGVQRFHLHAAPAGHPLWDRLLFRDHLRAHPEDARRYEELKLQLAREHEHDREAYTRGKAELVAELTKR